MHRLGEIADHFGSFGAVAMQARKAIERGRKIATENGFGEIEDAAAIGEAEHVAHARRGDVALAHRDRLIEDRETIANGAFRGAGDELQRVGIGLRAFAFRNLLEVRRKHRLLDASEIEALATRQHSDGDFTDFGRRENEADVRGRFLKCLQQRVERALRQHVNLVDDEHLRARDERRILRAFDDLADVVDAGVRGGVDFEHVGMTAFHDVLAVDTEARHVDGRLVNAGGFIVQRAGEDAGGRRLADAAHAGQHIALRDAPRREGVAERRHHRRLADQIVEGRGAVFARQHDVGLRRFGTSRARHALRRI